MKNILAKFQSINIKTLVFTAVLMSAASCSMEKRYHSSGFSFHLKDWDRSPSKEIKPKTEVKKRSALSTKSKFQNNALLAEKYNLKSQ